MFEQNGNAIGDFNMIDQASGLVHRARQRGRHGRQGLSAGHRGEIASGSGQVQAHLHGRADRRNVGKPVRKIGYIDLMKIRDPRQEGKKAAE